MIIVGLTGSIGMGKTTTAGIIGRLGVPLFDSDAEVHRLTRLGGGAMGAIAEAFPDLVDDGQLDRRGLSAVIFGSAAKRQRLENILHPLVRKGQQRFIRRQARNGARIVVVDVPLLFESRLESYFDWVVTVTADARIQRRRIRARPDMDEERLRDILAAQMPDSEKRRRGDYIIDTSRGRTAVYAAARRLVRSWSSRRGRALKLWKRKYA